jgi:two-component system, cell cycle response regulator DivK
MSAERIITTRPCEAPRPVALLVDRDSDTVAMYGEFLRQIGYDTEEAFDGREALAKAIARPPHVVVAEIRLTGIDGLDLCRLLRNDLATRHVPILIVTAHASEKDMQQARAAGCDAVLTKPCLPERLASEIECVLERADQSRARGSGAESPAPDVADVPQAEGQPSRGRARRVILSRAHQRYQTTTPPAAPPEVICPRCDRALRYAYSYVGGVNVKLLEQWDRFTCPAGCGSFQFRHRTRRLQRVP